MGIRAGTWMILAQVNAMLYGEAELRSPVHQSPANSLKMLAQHALETEQRERWRVQSRFRRGGRSANLGCKKGTGIRFTRTGADGLEKDNRMTKKAGNSKIH